MTCSARRPAVARGVPERDVVFVRAPRRHDLGLRWVEPSRLAAVRQRGHGAAAFRSRGAARAVPAACVRGLCNAQRSGRANQRSTLTRTNHRAAPRLRGARLALPLAPDARAVCRGLCNGSCKVRKVALMYTRYVKAAKHATRRVRSVARRARSPPRSLARAQLATCVRVWCEGGGVGDRAGKALTLSRRVERRVRVECLPSARPSRWRGSHARAACVRARAVASCSVCAGTCVQLLLEPVLTYQSSTVVHESVEWTTVSRKLSSCVHEVRV